MPRKAKNVLLVVESPAKARTIERYLGKGYTVAASMGHLIDLPKSRLAIDVDNGFEPEYITVRGKAAILRSLRQQAKNADEILLASDNDREGEAISFHLRRALLDKQPELTIRRVVFNEITPEAIRRAVATPGDIDTAKVNAQKARRVVDRLVGYSLSPLLWAKIKNGLSAGRVQSVALRLVCQREDEVERFVPEEYWTIEAELKKGRRMFRVALVEVDGTKPVLAAKADVEQLLKRIVIGSFVVADIRKSERANRPRPPFTTSTLQQTAANRLGFTSRKTMQIAQQLYEGVDIGRRRIGLITYMRTDSTRVSEAAIGDARTYIESSYPDGLPAKPNQFSTSKKAQDAHEAVRPTYVANTPADMKPHLSRDQLRLYSIIWERFVASQMKPAQQQSTVVDISNGAALFRASVTKTVDPGYQAVLSVLKPKRETGSLPKLSRGDELEYIQYHSEQHFTTGPTRYSDASMIKALEEQDIGRPSTYAPIISVLLDRYYVVRRNRALMPTVLGRLVDGLLAKAFPKIIDVSFTAELEERLDHVEEEPDGWLAVVRDFYLPFKKQVDGVTENLESIKGVMDEPTEHTCERCGKTMMKKLGKFGFFLACSGFPECRFTRPVPLADCPREGCTGSIVVRRRGGRGREFDGCTRYPDSDFVTYHKPTGEQCPRCGSFLAEKEDREHGTHRVCIADGCDYTRFDEDEAPADHIHESVATATVPSG